jgi:hypothetical protein
MGARKTIDFSYVKKFDYVSSISNVASMIGPPRVSTISKLSGRHTDSIAAVISGLGSMQSKIDDEKRMDDYRCLI